MHACTSLASNSVCESLYRVSSLRNISDCSVFAWVMHMLEF